MPVPARFRTVTIAIIALAFILHVPTTTHSQETIDGQNRTASDVETAVTEAMKAIGEEDWLSVNQETYKAMIAASQKTGLHAKRVAQVEEPATGWGMYKERSNNVYQKGEKIRAYIEPSGFKYHLDGDIFKFGFIVDFRLLDHSGKILGGQEGFGNFLFESHNPNTEIYLNLAVNLSGVESGNYRIIFRVRDRVGGETHEIPIVFSVTG